LTNQSVGDGQGWYLILIFHGIADLPTSPASIWQSCSCCMSSVGIGVGVVVAVAVYRYLPIIYILDTSAIYSPKACNRAAPRVFLLSPRDILSGRTDGRTRISPKTGKGGVGFRGRESMETSKRWIILQKRVRARARASRHKRGFHLSRHFHHTVDPIREYTRGGRDTRE